MLSLLTASLLAVSDVPPVWDAWLESTRELSLEAGQSALSLKLLKRSFVTALEPRRGVPSFLWAERFPGRRTPRAQGLSAVEAARTSLLVYAALYRLDGAAIAQLVVSKEHHSGGEGAVVVGFSRAHDGITYLRDELEVVMTAQYELVALTGNLATARPTGQFRLEAPAAISLAAQHLLGDLVAQASANERVVHEGKAFVQRCPH